MTAVRMAMKALNARIEELFVFEEFEE